MVSIEVAVIDANMKYEVVTNGYDCHPWIKHYAWLPVRTITGKKIWLKSLYKRKVWVVWGSGFHMEPEVQYATLFDLLGE